MSFSSYQFFLFFPVVVMVFYLIPKKIRSIWLLIISYFYYLCWDVKSAIWILLSTLTTFGCGLLLDKTRKNNWAEDKKRLFCNITVFSCLTINVGILLFFKYGVWLIENINTIFGTGLLLPANIIQPIGISFYTFQIMGYLIDVYNGKIYAERNIIKYALYISFFPKLTAGPIERAENLISQFNCDREFDYTMVKQGILIMVWGYFKKIVIADKAAFFVDSVFNTYQQQSGSIIVLAIILFTIQIYCDFSGYSDIAIGAAQVLGIKLGCNFRQPYFALDIRDFWKRWHISLSSWLRDYIYIPLGGSRCSEIKKYRNILITFLISGFWHGSGWHYIIWGGLHDGYQVVSDLTKGFRIGAINALHIKTNCFSYRLFKRLLTFACVSFAWLFFRADGLIVAFNMCKKVIFRFEPTALIGESIYLQGLNGMQLRALLISVLLMIAVDILHEKNISISKFMEQQNILFRWLIYYIVTLLIIISIIQTFGQDSGTFIYSRF